MALGREPGFGDEVVDLEEQMVAQLYELLEQLQIGPARGARDHTRQDDLALALRVVNEGDVTRQLFRECLRELGGVLCADDRHAVPPGLECPSGSLYPTAAATERHDRRSA